MTTTAIPEWFANAISKSRTSHYLHYENLKVVHYVKYSPEKHSTNKPSIIWVHGGFAHAHWWDFFAPFFVENFNCFAIDLRGCGNSTHQDEYSYREFSSDIIDLCKNEKLINNNKLYLIGHSMGASICMQCGEDYGEYINGMILLDGVIAPPELYGAPPPTNPKIYYYKTKEELMNRFQLRPPQKKCKNQFIIDYVKDHSVKFVEGKGWTWKFDKECVQKNVTRGSNEYQAYRLARIKKNVKVYAVYGEHSFFYQDVRKLNFLNEQMAEQHQTIPVKIYNAEHHIMADEPLQTIACIETIINNWEFDSIKYNAKL